METREINGTFKCYYTPGVKPTWKSTTINILQVKVSL